MDVGKLVVVDTGVGSDPEASARLNNLGYSVMPVTHFVSLEATPFEKAVAFRKWLTEKFENGWSACDLLLVSGSAATISAFDALLENFPGNIRHRGGSSLAVVHTLITNPESLGWER